MVNKKAVSKKKQSKTVLIRVDNDDYSLARKMLPNFDARGMRGLFHQLVVSYWSVNTFLPIASKELKKE